MKKKFTGAICGMLIAGILGGCGSSAAVSSSVTAGTSDASDASKATERSSEVSSEQASAVSGEAQTIKIWHDGDEKIMTAIADEVNSQLKADNIQVSFEKKTGLTDQLKLYGTDAQNGPDMYMYAHDSLGTFAEMGILAPVTDLIGTSDEADMVPMTVKAGTYKDTQYLLPIYYETLLFIYNKDLWKGDVPSTTDDLLTYMKANTDAANGKYAVVNQHSTAYNVAPFINGFGGCIISDDAKPGLDLQETKDAITYNKQFAELEGEGDYDSCVAYFNEGKAEAIVGGPWLVPGIKEAGINYGIKSLSEFKLPNGKALAPYSGVQGVGVLKYAAENKKDAVTKVLKAMCTPELGTALAKEVNCAPANSKTYEDSEVSSNEMIMAIRKTAETAQPMPNIPQMSVMWGPAESLLAAVNKSGEDVNSAADKYQKEAEKAIADMQ